MGCWCRLKLLLLTAIVVYVGIKIHTIFFQIPPIPKLEETWWGSGEAKPVDTSIRPFKINVPDQVLSTLKKRLEEPHSFTPPLEGINQEYGFNTNLLKEIIAFWKTKYNWREREQFLNKHPQFKTAVQGLSIHYIHVKPAKTSGQQVLPLLLLHGWPGSVRELYDIIPLLTTPQKDKNYVFEVIIPSLPGYGFSEAASKPGLGAAEMAVVFKNFMKRLGYEKYYIHGGDWGAIITSHMATLYPEHVLGYHTNMCAVFSPLAFVKMWIGSFYPPWMVSEKFVHKMYPFSNIFSNFMLEMGYMHLQATKPDTVGIALGDSPVGLAAYILEKFSTWTDDQWKHRADAGLKLKYTYTDLLDNVMIYYVTGSITTSMRLYSETFNSHQFSLGIDRIPITVPTACARFGNELAYSPDIVLQEKFHNLVQINDYETGGHFAAFEVPKVMADDIWTAVEKFRNSAKSK